MLKLQFLTNRQWQRRPVRLLLTVLSVAIAVAAVLGTSVAQSIVRSAYRNLESAAAGPPAIDIISSQGGRFAGTNLPSLSDLPPVRGAVPLLVRTTILRGKGQRARVLTVGVDFAALSRAEPIRLDAGSIPAEPDQVLLEARLARSLSLVPGDSITLFGRRGPRTMRISGLVSSESLRAVAEGAAVMLPLASAQDVYRLPDQIDRVRVLLTDADGRSAVERAVQERTGGRLQARAALRPGGIAEETLRSLELALRFSTALAVVMSVIVVLNTLRMNLHERRKEFAILRSLGASQRDLNWILAREGIVIGAIGGLAGIPAGIALVAVLKGVLGSLLDYRGEFPWPDWQTVLLALLVGETAVVAAIVWSEWGSGKISPAEAMRELDASTPEAPPWRWFGIAAIGWLAALVGLAGVRARAIHDDWTILFGLLMLMSYVAMLPVLLPLVLRASRYLVLGRSALYHLLTGGQFEQRPVRIGLTVGVVVVAISSGLGLGSAISGQIRDIRQWYRRTMSGDYFLLAIDASDPTGEGEGEIRRQLLAVPGVEHVEGVRFLGGRVGDDAAVCIVRDFGAGLPLPWLVSAERESALRSELARGDAVVSSILASRNDLHIGENVLVEIQSRSYSFRIAEIVTDYNFGGLTLFLGGQRAQAILPLGNPELWIVKESSPPRTETHEQLTALAPALNLSIQSFAQLRVQLDQIIGSVVGALWTLIAVGFVVSGFAVANTLAMHVIEQTRELGLLRVVGMPAWQTRRLILVQALLLGIAGAVLGTMAGVTTALVIHWCSVPLTGRSVPLEIPPVLLAANVIGGIAIALLAAVVPAWRAGRIEISQAIAYE